MKVDIVKQLLSVGDRVAFPDSGAGASLRLGEIIRMGDKMAIVRRDGGREYRRYYPDLVKVPHV